MKIRIENINKIENIINIVILLMFKLSMLFAGIYLIFKIAL